MDGLILILMLFSPLFAIMLFSWWLSRKTGYDPRGHMDRPLFRRDDIDFLKLPDFYSEEKVKERKSKANPHYDALVEAEWKAKRLEDEAIPEDASDEVRALSDLLEERKQK